MGAPLRARRATGDRRVGEAANLLQHVREGFGKSVVEFLSVPPRRPRGLHGSHIGVLGKGVINIGPCVNTVVRLWIRRYKSPD